MACRQSNFVVGSLAIFEHAGLEMASKACGSKAYPILVMRPPASATRTESSLGELGSAWPSWRFRINHPMLRALPPASAGRAPLSIYCLEPEVYNESTSIMTSNVA